MFKIKLGGGRTAEVEESMYWHTTSHIMAQAVKRLFPNAKLAIGPAIENGFYYDFDVEKPFTEEDLKAIEEEMKKVIKEDYALERFELPREEAIKLMEEKDEPYKVELIKDLPEGEVISFYKQGDFTDLCRGPHLPSTGAVKAVKLLSSSGAYWKGDEHNKMLQRIYGISFPKASEVDEYLAKLQEAKERDHRKIGKELELFMTHELVGSGLPMYLPKGATVRKLLERYIQDKETKMGYNHVYTPSLANVSLYKTSGHWMHYKDDMFPVMKMGEEEVVLRPMNCPHHMLIYRNKMHSYKELPIRIGELAHDFRFEDSGSVCGLERVREMCQNDAHLFVTPDQIKKEFKNYFNKKNIKKNIKTSLHYWSIGLIIMITCNIIISLITNGTLAANEEAVRAFLNDEISFISIGEIVSSVLDEFKPSEIRSYDDVMKADSAARAYVREKIGVCAQ